ncbi:C4-dicarboxylate ABC transporter [Betaproteobacteria bacterium GR16-43]|nr:C4-dicarboxylate ABC transporter [Betaproteobacteria bacterium GR16-43]
MSISLRKAVVHPALAAICVAMAAVSANARDFRSAEVHPPDYPTTLAVQSMGKQLTEQTKGRLNVKVYASGSLGTEKDTVEQLRIGGLDMMRINTAALNSVVPETLVTGLPFVFRSTEHMRKVLDGPIGDDILASMESQGLIGLAFYDSGARSFYTVKKPIKSVADMKGMKVRVQQSDLFVAMIEALGGNPTPMPYGEVYTALKTGIVDAAENNWPSYESSRHFETAKFYNQSEHSLAPEVLVFSKKIWDTLPKEDQALIRKAAKDSIPVMRKLWDEREIKSRKVVEAAGTQVVPIANKQEFIDAMKPVYAKFANTPRLQDLVKRIQETK